MKDREMNDKYRQDPGTGHLSEGGEEPRDSLLRETQRLLQESEERLRAIMDSALDMVFCKDMELRYNYVNPAMCKFLDCRPEDLVGRRPEDIYEPETAQTVLEVDGRVLAGETVNAVRQVSIRGKYYELQTIQAPLVRIDGQVFGISGFVRDVTEDLLTRKELEEGRRRYESLVECSPNGIIVHSEGQTVLVNSEAVRLLGFDRHEEMIGKGIWDYIHPDSHDEVRQRVARVYAGQGKVSVMELQFLRRDRSPVWVEAVAGSVEYQGKKASQVVFRDVSERHRARAEKERLEQQLLQAQKLEAIGRLAGGVAHDFNNLLTEISGSVSLALMESEPEGSNRGHLVVIEDAVNRAAALTRKLLTFSRKQVFQAAHLRLDDLVRDHERMLARLIGEDVSIGLSLESGAVTVNADAGQVEQALLNLVINAQDAMQGGGRLNIETRLEAAGYSPIGRENETTQGPTVVLSVEDNGCGMDSETLEHIFEPFFTTKSRDKGTGLGLWTTYGIVAQHGGRIDVTSLPGRGSKFSIRLEALEAPPDVPVAQEPLRVSAGNECVLLVEDEPVVREVAAAMLRKYGYEVLEVDGAEEAISLVDRESGTIDLLMTDVIMPGMNGRELARTLVEKRPGLKVLFMSGYSEEVIARRGILDEGVEFLGKPFRPQELAHKVRSVLDRPRP